MDIRLQTDSGDLLDSGGGATEVDDPLVDPELKVIVGLGTVTARGTPSGDPEPPPRHWHWATDIAPLLLQLADKGVANLLKVRELGRGDRETDLLGALLLDLLLLVTSDVAHVPKRPGQTNLLKYNCVVYAHSHSKPSVTVKKKVTAWP